MSSKPNPELIDDENPELTDEFLANARPAREALPEIFGTKVAARMLKPRGRPKLAAPKVPTTIRLDADIMAHLHATGAGWQTRVNTVLREAVEAGRV